jgi:lipopolysaccharide export LptBFGC system permease protein LptF
MSAAATFTRRWNRTVTAIVRLFPTGLLLIFLGLFIFALVDADRGPVWTFIGIILCLVFGSALTGLAL